MTENEGRWSEGGGEGSLEDGSRAPVLELYLLWARPALARHELLPGFLGCSGSAEKCRRYKRLEVRTGGEITGSAPGPASSLNPWAGKSVKA